MKIKSQLRFLFGEYYEKEEKLGLILKKHNYKLERINHKIEFVADHQKIIKNRE